MNTSAQFPVWKAGLANRRTAASNPNILNKCEWNRPIRRAVPFFHEGRGMELGEELQNYAHFSTEVMLPCPSPGL
jgi:hypothetical protein